MTSIPLLILWCAICGLASANSFLLPAYRDKVEIAHLHHEARDIGHIKGKLGRSLYWYGHWTVGATPDMILLIDTGSTDLILPKGRYKPTSHMTRYHGHQNFSAEYEGVNRAGFGFQQTNGTVRQDIVSHGDLVVDTQAIGEVESTKFFDVPTPKHENLSAGHGIIGFLGRDSSAFVPPARGWFRHLCYNKAVSECRFGVAFGTNGTGQVIIGKTAHQLIDGGLTPARILGGYTVKGDVYLNGKRLFENQTLIMDVGTDNIQAPPDPTKKIFDMLGFQTVIKTGKNLFDPAHPVEDLFGYFKCDKPPTIGFAFPTVSDLQNGQTQKVFNVSTEPSIWSAYDHGNNNCTSVLGGTSALTNYTTKESAWLIGQPFFQGHYIDFSIDQGTISYGNLKNPTKGT